MKYLIIGGGGIGGSLAAAMAENGLDITVIARGAHLQAIKEHGLKMETTVRGNYTVAPIRGCTAEEYDDKADVIFLCVKGYSVAEVLPLIKRAAHSGTVVIPLLNIYGLGGHLQEELPHLLVTDGCIYISAEIREAGIIRQSGAIFRVVFGVREAQDYRPLLAEIESDLKNCGIETILSCDIKRDAFRKYTYVSAMAACGQYYDINAAAMQKEGKERQTFIALVQELGVIAQAMGIDFGIDIVENNLKILDSLAPTASTSMQRDLKQGSRSEIDGLIFEVLRMAEKEHVSVPNYVKIAAALEKFRTAS